MNFPSLPFSADQQHHAGHGLFGHQGADPFAAIISVVKSRRWTILGVALAAFAICAFMIARMTPIYTATSTVMIDKRGSRIVDLDAVVDGVTADPRSIRNQIEVLRSRSLAARVVTTANLLEDPQFHSLPNPDDPVPAETASPAQDDAITVQEDPAMRRAISRLIGALEVENVGGSVLTITMAARTGENAAMLANAYANAYLLDQLNTRFEASQRATAWLAKRLESLSDEVRSAEQAVEHYKIENGITITNGSTLITQQVAELNSSLIAARTARAQEEVKLRRIQQVARGGGNLEAVSEVGSSPVIASLRAKETEAQRRRAELATRYGAEHPSMLNVAAEIQDVRSQINAEINRVVEAVRSDVAVARAREQSLQRSLSEMEGRLQEQNKSGIELRNLEAVAATKRAIYDNFVEKMSQAEQQEGLDTENTRILSVAIASSRPSRPKKPMLYTVAMIGAIGLGLMIAFILDALDSGFRTEEQAESILQLPVLATVPEVGGKAKKEGRQAQMVVDKPLSGFSEAVRSVQSALSLANVDAPPKVILLTSSMPKEGKTTLSINLARHHATHKRKVLLIDGDLRHPTVAKTLRLKPTAGVVEILAGDATFEDAVMKDPLTDLDILPVFKSAANQSHLLDSETIRKLIDDLRHRYDHIVIDSAPILPVNDTKFLSKTTDAVLFVIRWEKTPRDAARDAVKRLKDIEAPLVGIVFSRADGRRHSVYAYGYGYRYGEYVKYYQ